MMEAEAEAEELAKLIKEQAADDSSFARPEPFTIHYANASTFGSGAGRGIEYIDQVEHLRDTPRACPLHGYTTMYISIRGEAVCRECARLRGIAYRKTHIKTEEQVATRSKKRKERYANDEEFRERTKRASAKWRKRIQEQRSPRTDEIEEEISEVRSTPKQYRGPS